MSGGLNKIMIIGNLGKDPEMKYTPTGKTVTSFSVAVNEDRNDENGNVIKKTGWFRVTVWEKRAEICNQYLHKGSKVYIEGRIEYDPATGYPRIWTATDGTPRCNTEITATTVLFLSSKTENEALAAKSSAPVQSGPAVSNTEPVDSGFDTLPPDSGDFVF